MTRKRALGTMFSKHVAYYMPIYSFSETEVQIILQLKIAIP